MRKSGWLLIAVATLFVFPVSAQDSGIKKGDTATLPFWREVEVVNLVGIQHPSLSDEQIKYGDTCQVAQGGAVTVVGIDSARVLVRYKASASYEPRGVACPTGVLFFVSKDRFSRMTAEGKKREQDFVRQVTRPAKK